MYSAKCDVSEVNGPGAAQPDSRRWLQQNPPG